MKTTEPPSGGNVGTEKGAPELESGLRTKAGQVATVTARAGKKKGVREPVLESKPRFLGRQIQ